MRKKLFAFVVAPAIVLFALAVAVVVVLRYEPAFYRQAVPLDPSQARAEAKQFVSQLSRLVNDIQNESSWSAIFSEAQLNAWLAEDFKRKHADRLPAGVSDLRVSLRPARALLGYRSKFGPLTTVVSVSVQVWLPEPNLLALKLERVAAGALPIPLDYLMDDLTQTARRSDWPIEWKQHDGRPLALVRLPDQSEGDVIRLCKLLVARQAVQIEGDCISRESADQIALQKRSSAQ